MSDQEQPNVPPPPPPPPAKQEEPMDFSQFDDSGQLGAVPMGDDEALKKISRRTSPFGRTVFGLIVLLTVASVAVVWWTSQRQAEAEAQLEAVASIEDPEQVKSELRRLLDIIKSQKLRQRIIMNLGHYRDEAAVPQLMTALDEPGVVRRAAAWALERIGSPAADVAKPKLLQVLPKTDERDRAQVVWTLAVLGEGQASDAIVEQFSLGMLQGLEGFDAKVITDVLGPARLGSEELLTHKEESVRRLTAHALAEAASPEVVEPLTRLLDGELRREGEDQSQEVIRAAAAGLGRTGDPRAARPLFAVLENVPSMSQSVLDALRASTGAPELVTLAKEASDISVKRDMVRLLASAHDPRIADDLAQLMASEDAEIREAATFALADLRDKRAAPVLVEYARGDDTAKADRALGALMYVANPEISADLGDMLKEMEHRRASVLRIIGAAGDPNLAGKVEEQLSSEDAGAAAEALAKLNDDGAYKKLLDWVPRPRDTDMGARNAAERSLTNEDLLRKRRAAIQAMGLYGRPDAFDVLATVVEDDVKEDYELRALAARSIGQLAGDEELRKVIERIRDSELDDQSRRYYVQALWQRAHPELNGEMLALIGDDEAPIPVRRAAALAVGYTSDEDTDTKLTKLLDSEGARRHAALAIALSGGEAAVAKLIEILPEDNDTREILQTSLMNETNDWFNLVTEEMFDNGLIYRRLRAGNQLRAGDEDQSFGYAWAKAINVLRSGWDGPGGASAHFVRTKLYEVLTDEATKPDLRQLVAEALAAIPERGLLLRARDEGGIAGPIARAQLTGAAKK